MRTTRREWFTRQLEDEQQAFELWQQRVAVQGDKRNRLIREALAAGVKQADIARITGLSRERVRQLR